MLDLSAKTAISGDGGSQKTGGVLDKDKSSITDQDSDGKGRNDDKKEMSLRQQRFERGKIRFASAEEEDDDSKFLNREWNTEDFVGKCGDNDA